MMSQLHCIRTLFITQFIQARKSVIGSEDKMERILPFNYTVVSIMSISLLQLRIFFRVWFLSKIGLCSLCTLHFRKAEVSSELMTFSFRKISKFAAEIRSYP